VQVRHVVTAVEVIVDEHLPVAVEEVVLAVEPMQPRELEPGDFGDDVGPQELDERRAVAAMRTKTQFSQVSVATGTRPLAGRVEVAHALEGRAALSVPSSV